MNEVMWQIPIRVKVIVRELVVSNMGGKELVAVMG
jgi:hypothetical protein